MSEIGVMVFSLLVCAFVGLLTGIMIGWAFSTLGKKSFLCGDCGHLLRERMKEDRNAKGEH